MFFCFLQKRLSCFARFCRFRVFAVFAVFAFSFFPVFVLGVSAVYAVFGFSRFRVPPAASPRPGHRFRVHSYFWAIANLYQTETRNDLFFAIIPNKKRSCLASALRCFSSRDLPQLGFRFLEPSVLDQRCLNSKLVGDFQTFAWIPPWHSVTKEER